MYFTQVHMGTHMWTSGASRRGKRMSLDLPMNRPPLPLTQQDSDFLQRRPDLFYPYLPSPFLNGLHQQVKYCSYCHRFKYTPITLLKTDSFLIISYRKCRHQPDHLQTACRSYPTQIKTQSIILLALLVHH